MGGNTIINSIIPDKINLKEYSRKDLYKDLITFLESLNLYNDELLYSKFIFNGSSSFIFDFNEDESKILKYKPILGDIDLVIDKNKAKDLFLTLQKMNINIYNKDINKLGNTIIILKKFRNYNIQIDFELVDFENNKPTEFALFSRSSTLKDYEYGIKGVFSKLLLRAIAGSINNINDFVLLTPKSTLEKPRIKRNQPNVLKPYKFSVQYGLTTNAYEYLGLLGDKKAYKEISTKDRIYIKDLDKIASMLLNTTKDKLYSFIDLVQEIKKLDKDRINLILKYFDENINDKYLVIDKDINEDKKLKEKALNYIIKELK